MAQLAPEPDGFGTLGRAVGALPAAAPWALLATVLAGVLAPAVLLDLGSRVFLLKLAGVALLAGLPGWLYLQFLAQRGYSLYDEYVLNLFRLQIDEDANLPAPPQHTSYYARWAAAHQRLRTPSTDNLYRRKFEAVYGRAAVSTRALFAARTGARDRAEALSPVLAATVVLAVGWILILEPDLYRAVRLLEPAGTTRPDLPVAALQFGFLGAYFFVLQDLLRRYYRDDLRAGAYVSALVRVVLVAILVTTLDLVWPAALDGQAVFAFFVGLFPQVGLQALRAGLARPLRRLLPSVRTDQPLSQLEGLSIWSEARLVEEGIEDLQNLTSANLVDLLLHTRVPVARLVDWVDQACLRLHLPGGPEHAGVGPALRRLGIRTATDFVRAWSADNERPALVHAFASVLDVDADGARSAGGVLRSSLDGEPNLFHVARFRQRQWLAGESADGARSGARPAEGHDDAVGLPAPAGMLAVRGSG